MENLEINNVFKGEELLFKVTEEVFTTMLALPICKGPAKITSEAANSTERVVAFIGIAGPYIGTGMICCSPRLACKVASNMLMADYAAVDGEVLDIIGEITNMIFGNVKTALEERVGPLGLSIPTVIFGRNFDTRSTRTQSWIVVPCQVEEEDVEIRLCVSANRTAVAPQKRASFSTGHAVLAGLFD